MNATESNFVLANPISKLVSKPQKDFTRGDLMRVIANKGIILVFISNSPYPKAASSPTSIPSKMLSTCRASSPS